MTSDTVPTTPSKTGRPSDYTPELAAQILECLADGMSMRALCEIDGMPHRSTILTWARRHVEFAAAYAEAMKQRADVLFEEMRDIADDATPTSEKVDRLRIDVRRFQIGRLNPKKYSEKIQAEVSGPDGRPLQLQPVCAPMVPKQVAVAVRDLISKAETDMGLPAGTGTDQERLQALVASGEPLSPEIYEVLHADKG